MFGMGVLVYEIPERKGAGIEQLNSTLALVARTLYKKRGSSALILRSSAESAPRVLPAVLISVRMIYLPWRL